MINIIERQTSDSEESGAAETFLEPISMMNKMSFKFHIFIFGNKTKMYFLWVCIPKVSL